MNPQTARALAGEHTVNLAPYTGGLPPALRRPDATGEIPARREPVTRAPARPAASVRPGRGRHRATSAPPWALVLALECVVAVLLAAGAAALVVTR